MRLIGNLGRRVSIVINGMNGGGLGGRMGAATEEGERGVYNV